MKIIYGAVQPDAGEMCFNGLPVQIASPVAQRRLQVARSLHERAFAWITMADERNLVAARVAGELRYRRGATP